MRKPYNFELIDWSERCPNESSLEIAFRQSTVCRCGGAKEIGVMRCKVCEAINR